MRFRWGALSVSEGRGDERAVEEGGGGTGSGLLCICERRRLENPPRLLIVLPHTHSDQRRREGCKPMGSVRVSLLSALLYYKTTISSSNCHKNCGPIRISARLSVNAQEGIRDAVGREAAHAHGWIGLYPTDRPKSDKTCIYCGVAAVA